MNKALVVIPTWNDKESLILCLDSLSKHVGLTDVLIVDNGSSDGTEEIISAKFPDAIFIRNEKNLGFAGGVNVGIKTAFELGYEYVALLNNDAVADSGWLSALLGYMQKNDDVGIATSKILKSDTNELDSTGELYSVWGLPFPRGREETDRGQYDESTTVFGASGGASLYRMSMLKVIDLFDESFFAYYEDVDISFRAQLAGWKVAYVPGAKVYHQIGGTSAKIKGFTTYQTMKNLPMLLWKNVPTRLLPVVLPRFVLAYLTFYLSAAARGHILPASKGLVMSILLWPSTLKKRRGIQHDKKVTDEYINSIVVRDLPPNALKLRQVRKAWRKLTRKGR